jgi:hypothetical protein
MGRPDDDGAPRLRDQAPATRERLRRSGIWAPGTVPPGMIERAVSAAWPGATLTIEEPPPEMPDAPPEMPDALHARVREHGAGARRA